MAIKMKLNIIKPKEPTALAKMTVHKTGKLGLSKGAMELLDVETNKFAKFGYNEEGDFFMVMCIEPDEETFNVAKAGAYYYITAKTLLEDLEIDYKSENTTIFDIVRTDEREIYKLIKRVIKK
ncbi:MAG TPA: hypothetical protein DCP54_07980 [Chryseobacterium sp.]|nr:hypothetical protein [Chryseobacterium sp.]